MLLGEPLDGAEKRRSKGTVSRCSAWVPVTHASVVPRRDVFQTCAVAALAGFAVAARFLAFMRAAKVTK
jgi:hypothetical protein